MVRKLLIAAALLCSGSPLFGQAYFDLPIAYVKVEGPAQSIYLTNASGSQTVRVYVSPSKATITHLDLNPLGGEIAFIERRSGYPAALKVLALGTSSPRTIPTRCVPSSADYDQSGAVLIIADGCYGNMLISTLRTDGSGYQVLQQGPWFDSPRWLSDGSYVYARALTTAQQLCRNNCDAGDVLWSGYQVGRMDVGRLHNWVVFDDTTTSEVDADTHVLRSNVINGKGAHFSPNDTSLLYMSPHSASGDYLLVRNPQGYVVQITGKGTYGPTDWRK